MRVVAQAALVVIWVIAAAVARAEPATKPWAVGVSDAEQTVALATYQKANAEFEEARYTQALVMYRTAITHWDHPAIRFNMVVCLVNLDQPLEAFEDVEAALKYGAEPLGADVYAQALTYKKLLLAQLARIDVSSDESGAAVTLDGVALFTAPGHIEKIITPGNHVLVATKEGYHATTMSLVLVGGTLTSRKVSMSAVELTITRRWSAWKPWAVVIGGAALAVTGGLLESRAYTNYQRYDTAFDATSACSRGCGGPGQPAIPASLVSLHDRASRDNALAIGMFVGGGVALAAGAFGVYIDQPHAAARERAIAVAPALGPHNASLALVGAF
jgi:hypothetical protein